MRRHVKDIEAFVKSPQRADAIVQFLYGGIHRQLVAGSRGFFFLDHVTHEQRSLKGVTDLLAAVYWPQENVSFSTHRRRIKRRLASSSTTKKTGGIGAPPLPRSSVMGAMRGHLRGSTVHRQIEELLTMDEASFLRRHPGGVHPWVAKIIHYLNEYDLKLVHSELIVGDIINGIGTAIDMVAIDRRGRLYFIELKTGYETAAAWRGKTGTMKGNLNGIYDNTAENRAIVQIMIGTVLAVMSRMNGTERSPTDPFVAWVLHVGDDFVGHVEVDRRTIGQLGPMILRDLIQHLTQRRLAKTSASVTTVRAARGKQGSKKKNT